ncbi:uncharacterized protein IWZ02DRAFT_315266 [Phyllosticta citriasiana]|uniref:uncharacterized protein n=1 Tax=Phyllosticta citriasiana TaxID=595635 RepID=UPI0030FD7F4A
MKHLHGESCCMAVVILEESWSRSCVKLEMDMFQPRSTTPQGRGLVIRGLRSDLPGMRERIATRCLATPEPHTMDLVPRIDWARIRSDPLMFSRNLPFNAFRFTKPRRFDLPVISSQERTGLRCSSGEKTPNSTPHPFRCSRVFFSWEAQPLHVDPSPVKKSGMML